VPAANGAIVEDVVARIYRLVVEGELDDEMDGLEAFTLTAAAGTTTLTGPVRDQAELHGIVQRLTSLDVRLLEITAIDEAGRPVGIAEPILS
jgi:hypothetical protein